MTHLAVFVVELDLPDVATADALTATAYRVGEHLHGLPARRTWATTGAAAAAVTGLHNPDPTGEQAVLAAGRRILRRHGHSITAACTPACERRRPS